ncbi:MAG: hypothetical protein M3Q47_11480 [Actinomycetota bacterium]|nr:hypothetical protein [Actinomycetota bacterium]
MARGSGTVRGIGVGVCSVALLWMGAPAALACDTGSWLTVDGDAGSGTVVTVRGGGFAPGTMTLVWDRSAGQVLGDAAVAPDGTLQTRIEIPSDAAGAHKVIAVPVGEVESPTGTHAWTDVVVPTGGVGPPTTPTSTAQTTQTGREAPESAAPAPVALGLGALVVAVLAVVLRRRTASTVPDSDDTPDDLDAELRSLVAGPHGHRLSEPGRTTTRNS